MPFNPLEHRVLAEFPERAAQSAWIEHTPFAMLLIDLIRPSVFVELGTYLGTSYCAFCQAVKELNVDCRCYAVDNWAGDEHGGFYESGILEDLRAHHDPRYSSFSQLVQAQFDDALPMFPDGSIDLLHIDGYHTYEAVKHDFDTWLPKLSPRAVVALHDTAEHMEGFGVWRFWDELKARYPQHVELVHGHGLGIVAVGAELPAGFQQLVEMSPSQWLSFRDLLHELGSRVGARQAAQALTDQYTQQLSAAAQRAESLEAERDWRLADQTGRYERELAQQAKRYERDIAEQASNYERDIAEQASNYERDIAEQAERYERESQSRETQAIQLRSAQTRRYEAELATTRAQLSEIETVRDSALWRVKWLESSRGVRAVILARASREVLRHRGPFSLAKHGILWLAGRRGYHLRDIYPTANQQAAIAAPATQTGAAANVREQRLPSPAETFTGVSIVIPVFNALDDARACVESIYRVGADLPFEVIVIDNGSRPDVLEWLREQANEREQFWYISLSENLGFSRGMNLGIDHARGIYVALQNSDTVVTHRWLDNLIAALQNDPQLAVISPMTNYVGNGPQIAEDARQLPVDRAETYAASIADRTTVQYIADRLVFFCVIIPRRVLTLLGGLSGSYGMGNFEDDDYCVRALMAGYTLGIARNAFVFHSGSKTFSANKINHDGILDANRVTFVSRVSKLSSAPLPALWRERSLKTEPLVSVVVRTKDRAPTLSTALMSLANQTLDRFEVVVVNDGGQDVSPVLERFERQLALQYVRHDTPRGAAAALNTGLKTARGEWMAYLDDDDIVYPYHLNALLSAVRDSGARFAYADHTRALIKTGPSGEPIPIMWRPIPTWEYDLGDLHVQDYLPIHTWLHSREDAIELGGFRNDLDVHEDWDLLLRLAQRYPFTPTRQVSAEYRFYLDSLSNSIIQRRARSLELLEVMYQQYPVPEPAAKILESREIVRKVVRQQIEDIDGIQRLLERHKITAYDAKRRTVAAVTGMLTD